VGSYGFTQKDISVIHNGIGIPEYSPGSFRGRVVIGSAGRLFPVKDFSLLVDIAQFVISRDGNVEFLLAGDGPERAFLEAKVREYGIQDQFVFLSHVEDMDAFYRKLDIYINTSVHEGIPMSVLEAMSYGLPVVVPNVGGFPEIVVDGEQGFLVEDRQKDKYAECILQLAHDPELHAKMAGAARERVVDCFSREAMARAYFDVYSLAGQD
jgi:glycosyltransferase involved in cell wall biosynthesis